MHNRLLYITLNLLLLWSQLLLLAVPRHTSQVQLQASAHYLYMFITVCCNTCTHTMNKENKSIYTCTCTMNKDRGACPEVSFAWVGVIHTWLMGCISTLIEWSWPATRLNAWWQTNFQTFTTTVSLCIDQADFREDGRVCCFPSEGTTGTQDQVIGDTVGHYKSILASGHSFVWKQT